MKWYFCTPFCQDSGQLSPPPAATSLRHCYLVMTIINRSIIITYITAIYNTVFCIFTISIIHPLYLCHNLHQHDHYSLWYFIFLLHYIVCFVLSYSHECWTVLLASTRLHDDASDHYEAGHQTSKNLLMDEISTMIKLQCKPGNTDQSKLPMLLHRLQDYPHGSTSTLDTQRPHDNMVHQPYGSAVNQHVQYQNNIRNALYKENILTSTCNVKSSVSSLRSHRVPFQARDNIPSARDNIPSARDNIPSARDNIPAARDNFLSARDNIPAARDNFLSARDNIPATRENFPTAHENFPAARENFFSACHIDSTRARNTDYAPAQNLDFAPARDIEPAQEIEQKEEELDVVSIEQQQMVECPTEGPVWRPW